MTNGILVTGMSRSGTTWVGKMLAASPTLAYLHEPTNIDCAWHMWNLGVPHQFVFLTEENSAGYRRRIQRLLRLEPNWRAVLETRGNPILLRRMIGQARFLRASRRQKKRPLLKDPLAVFSSDWLARAYGLPVVVTVRHPAAVARSRRDLQWRFDFGHILRQRALMDVFPEGLQTELTEFAASTAMDIVDESAMLWKLVYWYVRHRASEAFITIRHEDLCRNPLEGFQSLFDRLGVRFDEAVAQVITENTRHVPASNPARTDIRRNSRDLIGRWKDQLSAGEIERVRQRVDGVSQEFYSDADW